MSLADLSAQIRNFLKWFLITVVVLLLLWVAWIIVLAASRAIFKPGGEATAFGKIAPPFFVKTYPFLETEKPPSSTPSANVASKMPVYSFTTSKKFSQQQIEKLISFFNLSTNSEETSGSTVTWQDSSGLASLRLDTNLNHFVYKYQVEKNLSLISGKANLDQNVALEKAKETLLSLGLSPANIDKNSSVVKYLKISADKREFTISDLSNTYEVSLFRKIGNISTTGDPPIRILFTGDNKILEFDYNYSPLDPAGSPYPIISGAEAWQAFQSGRVYTTATEKFVSIKVTNMHLSYWESKIPQQLLQPVWVFVGTGKTSENDSQGETFTAFLPAVSPSYLVSGSE